MPRPSFIAPAAFALFAVFSLTGCKTIYSDTYSPRRNHFKPVKEMPRPAELLPTPKLDSMPAPVPAAQPAPPAPGMEPAAPAPGAPAPAAPGAPAAPAAPPKIPGL